MFKKMYCAAAIAGAMLVPGAAQAAITVTSVGLELGHNGTLNYTPGGLPNGGTSVNVGVGRLALNGTSNGSAVSYLSYCMDIFDYVRTGTFNVETFSFSPGKMAQLTALLTNTATAISSAANLDAKKDTAAAIQMAVWEIAFEAGQTGYSIANGQLTMSGTTANARSLATSYLNQINANSWTPNMNYALMKLVPVETANSRNQTQVFLVNAPVPEPETWAMLILGFGMVGGAMRTRRRTTLSFA